MTLADLLAINQFKEENVVREEYNGNIYSIGKQHEKTYNIRQYRDFEITHFASCLLASRVFYNVILMIY